MATQLDAAAGFGVYCKDNDIVFNIPSIGNVGIGMEYVDVLKTFQDSCERKLDIRWDGANCIFSNNDNDILSIATKGPYVVGVKYKDIAQQIVPQYEYDNKSYLTNEKIEGHMLWVKNRGEITLKSVKDVPGIEHTAADFGVSPKKKNREFVAYASKVQKELSEILQTKSSTEPEVNVVETNSDNNYESIEKEISDLSWKKFLLEQHMDSLTSDRSRTFREYRRAKETYDNAVQHLDGTYSDITISGDPSLNELIEKGKISKDCYGAHALSKDITNDVSWTKETRTEFIESDDILQNREAGVKYIGKETREIPTTDNERYPGIDQDNTYMRRLYDDVAPVPYLHTEDVFHYYREQEVDVKHPDEAYDAACKWVTSQEYAIAHKDVRNMYVAMTQAKEKYESICTEIEDYKKSPKYALEQKELKEIRIQLRTLEAKKTAIEQNQQDQDFEQAINDLSDYANTSYLQQ